MPGRRVENWTPPPRPGPETFEGRFARLERLDPDRHAGPLHAAMRADERVWDYLPYGPFARAEDYAGWMRGAAAGADPLFYAILDRTTGTWGGVASFLRIAPEAGSIEVGHLCFAPALQRRPAATEAMALMMAWAFSAGYRRYEWKCDALNLPSRRAAERLGLSYEGIFRQAAVVKGRNRDTAWFAAIDAEWPALQAAFDRWLAPENFAPDGTQHVALSSLTVPLLAARDPALAR